MLKDPRKRMSLFSLAERRGVMGGEKPWARHVGIVILEVQLMESSSIQYEPPSVGDRKPRE